MAAQVPSGACGVKEFFEGRCVLVTGATGFMGKVMLEKLLRTCGRMKKLYFLVRTKSDMGPQQRMKQLLKAELFERVLKEHPEAVAKMVPITGDVTWPSLGLSEEDQKTLTEEVSVVFHLAATVRFDEPLRKALDINVRGTKRVVDLCRKMQRLKVLVYVSTAYGHCQREDIGEEFYPSFVHPLQLMDVLETMDEELVRAMTPLLLSGRPSTYCLSKAMAEQLLVEEAADMPVAVVRPSIVSSTWKEPFPGWTESYFGPNGLLVAYAKGLQRCFLSRPDQRADFVPVDVATNLTIAAAWYTATRRPQETLVYNCTSGAENKLTWEQNMDYSCEIQERRPLKALWYPTMTRFQSWFLFRAYFYLSMLYPGCLVDAVALLTGKKPGFVRMQKKILKMNASISFYLTREWRFRTGNAGKLREAMSARCRRDFDFDTRDIDWRSYYEDTAGGIKRFLVKEDPAGMDDDLRHARRLRLVHRLCQLAMALGLLRLLWWTFC